MNRFSTLSAVIGIAAAALLAQPLAAQAAGAGHPVIGGGMRSNPIIDPPSHGIVVDPIVGRPVFNQPNGTTPVAPIQKAPVLGGGKSVKPVLGGGKKVVPSPIQDDASQRSTPITLPGHGTIVDPKIGVPAPNDANQTNPVAPIQKVPVLGGGNSVHHIPVDPIPLPRRPVPVSPKRDVPAPIQSEKP
jgi:hypothetical protein